MGHIKFKAPSSCTQDCPTGHNLVNLSIDFILTMSSIPGQDSANLDSISTGRTITEQTRYSERWSAEREQSISVD